MKKIIDYIIFIVVLILFALSVYDYGQMKATLHMAEHLVELQIEEVAK